MRYDLHANAVRLVGSDVGRLTAVAEIALGLGIEVWFSPTFFEYSLEETAARTVAAVEAAAPLAAAHAGRIVFVAGSELTLFMQGIIAGKSVTERLQRLKGDPALLNNGKLKAYLAAMVPRLRARFDGALTYASLTFEQVDWEPFDYVGVDHYREARTKEQPRFQMAAVASVVSVRATPTGPSAQQSSGRCGHSGLRARADRIAWRPRGRGLTPAGRA